MWSVGRDGGGNREIRKSFNLFLSASAPARCLGAVSRVRGGGSPLLKISIRLSAFFFFLICQVNGEDHAFNPQSGIDCFGV